MSHPPRFAAALVAAVVLVAAFLPPSPVLAADDPALTRTLESLGVPAPGGVAALLIRRLEDGHTWEVGGPQIDARRTPASTSKVPHALIALESGLVDSPDSVFRWDGTERVIPAWNQDQTLRSAVPRSAVWVFQEIARRAGGAHMAHWLERLDYGNADVGGPEDLTTYWLRGPLAISTREQVAFLERLVTDALPLSADTMAEVRSMLQLESGPGWRLFGKTGWRADGENTDIGWLVGWLESEAGGLHLYAFTLDMPDPRRDAPLRKAAVLGAFRTLGLIPPG